MGILGKNKVVVFCETQMGKDAVMRDGAAETGRGWIAGAEKRKSGDLEGGKEWGDGGLVGITGWRGPGDFPLQRSGNHSHLRDTLRW